MGLFDVFYYIDSRQQCFFSLSSKKISSKKVFMRNNKIKSFLLLGVLLFVVLVAFLGISQLDKARDFFSQANVSNKNYTLQARIKFKGRQLNLNTPLYITDVYTGVWNGEKQTANDFWEKPLDVSGNFYVGEYTRESVGSEAMIRKKLQLMKDYQITPSIHIFNRRLINKVDGQYRLVDWNNYGMSRGGKAYFSYDIFNNFWKPILEDMKIPYLITIDMWGFSHWAPSDIPPQTYYRLWWEELEHVLMRINQRDSADGSNYHIRFREYTDNTEAYWPGMVLLHMETPRVSISNACHNKDNSVRYAFMKAAGNPGGTGVNPVSGNYLALNAYFWFNWYTYTPDIKDCIGNNGIWNVVNFQWGDTDIDRLNRESDWVEGMDNLGPRYFYGYFPHFRDKKSAQNPRLYNNSGSNMERNILQNKAIKGAVFVGYWNEYAETVFEPSMLINPNQGAEYNPWVNNRPVRLDNFFRNKIKTSYPEEIRTPILTTLP